MTSRIVYLKNRSSDESYSPEWIDGAYPELLTWAEKIAWDEKFASCAS